MLGRSRAAAHVGGRAQPGGLPALALFTDRAPLFVFAGDVGCGKTALAEIVRLRPGRLPEPAGLPYRLS